MTPVPELEWNPRSAEIVASIVSLARSLHFTALGECVETQEQKERLHDRGCTRYQGCLFSRALSLDDLLVELTGAERCRREEDPDESATTSG